jgi:multidrug resistance protein, MATE family
MLIPPQINLLYLLNKAWPIILANAAVPFLGLADTAVIGNVGSIEELGAIAFGALIFSFVYWSFGFLRMGTTGFVAQAMGRGDEVEIRAALGRALLLASGLGVAIILLQWPIAKSAFLLLDGSTGVESVAQEYFFVRIWGAPATLTTFALMGLLIGLGNSRQLLIVQLFLNGLNVLLDVWFAGVLQMGATGIALGTVIAEWITVLFAGVLVWRELEQRRLKREPFWDLGRIFDPHILGKTLTANSDIMIRTLLMIFSFSFFMNQSARFGDAVLAANHILMQMISFAAFFLDGYAFVVESIVGTSIGARRLDSFKRAVSLSTLLAFATAIMLAMLIWVFGDNAVALLTDIGEVRQAAMKMLSLPAIYVLLSFAAFQLDGIFIGASCTRQMRHAAFISVSIFLVAWWLLIEPWGVIGLWWAMIVYVSARALALLMFYGKVQAKFK